MAVTVITLCTVSTILTGVVMAVTVTWWTVTSITI